VNDSGISESDILACVTTGERLKHRGYQGIIHTGRVADKDILVKSAAGTGIMGWVNRRMIRREYRMYCRLTGVDGIPRCFGFFMGRYLALEYVKSRSLRHATIRDRDDFFAQMRTIIRSLHDHGVAHGDLHRKDNILVTDDLHPCLIDFGVAVFRKSGFHPFNHFLYDFSRQQDINSWLKHKYGGKLQDISPGDAEHYRPLRISRIARTLKPAWTRIRRVFNLGRSPG